MFRHLSERSTGRTCPSTRFSGTVMSATTALAA
jgi:hypothetical protein